MVSGTYAVMAPASVWFTKQLPEEKWINLIKTVSKKMPVYLIGAPSDSEFIGRLILESGVNNCENTAGQLNLLESCRANK